MFAVIRRDHFDAADGTTIDTMVREEFVPLIRQAPGFIRYYWLDTGDGEGASTTRRPRGVRRATPLGRIAPVALPSPRLHA